MLLPATVVPLLVPPTLLSPDEPMAAKGRWDPMDEEEEGEEGRTAAAAAAADRNLQSGGGRLGIG